MAFYNNLVWPMINYQSEFSVLLLQPQTIKINIIKLANMLERYAKISVLLFLKELKVNCAKQNRKKSLGFSFLSMTILLLHFFQFSPYLTLIECVDAYFQFLFYSVLSKCNSNITKHHGHHHHHSIIDPNLHIWRCHSIRITFELSNKNVPLEYSVII